MEIVVQKVASIQLIENNVLSLKINIFNHVNLLKYNKKEMPTTITDVIFQLIFESDE